MARTLDSVRTRIALAILAASLGASALLYGLNAAQRAGAARQEAEREVGQRRAAVHTALEEEKRLASSLALVLANSPPVASAALAGDHLALQAQISPAYEAMKRQFGRVILTASVTPGVVLLRLHDPAARGDEYASRRTTVRETYRTGQGVAGLEPGRDNISAFAGAPVLRPDGTVGAVIDLGLTIGDSLAARVKDASTADVTFFQQRGDSLVSIGSTQQGRPLLPQATLAGALREALQTDALMGRRRAIVAAEPLRGIDGQVMGVIEIGIDVEDRAAMADAADRDALLAALAAPARAWAAAATPWMCPAVRGATKSARWRRRWRCCARVRWRPRPCAPTRRIAARRRSGNSGRPPWPWRGRLNAPSARWARNWRRALPCCRPARTR
jgi:methyl-accepting chemotaxis protein